MPAIMISAEVGSIPKVTGISSAMLADGPMPGSTPTIVPRSTPTKVYQRLIGWRQTRKAVEDVGQSFHGSRLSERQDAPRQA